MKNIFLIISLMIFVYGCVEDEEQNIALDKLLIMEKHIL